MRCSAVTNPFALLRRFRDDCRGQVGAVFAISILPVLALTGSGVEYSLATEARVRLQNALDGAALAVMSEGPSSQQAAQTALNTYMGAMLNGTTFSATVTAFNATEGLVAEAVQIMDTHILEIVGLPTLHLTADTQIVAGGSAPLEIALVVDNTGSMYGNGGIEALKGAVEDFMDVLESVHAEEGSIRISLVPFSNTVNIRGDSFDWAWMDTEARAEWHGDQFDESAGPVNVFDLYDAIPNVEWGGCVEYRGGGYEVSDAAPTSADPDTLFVPWMIPDDPDFWPDDRTIRGNNRWSRLRVQYLPDDLPPFDERHPYHEQDLTQIRSTGKYNGTPAVFESGTFTRGPNSGCSQTPIIPLQTSISRIRTAVRDLENPQGWGTDHLMGLMWGWRVLSPGEPYDEGAPYGEARKIIIMMTDGELNMGGTTNIDTPQRSYYTGYGFASEARRSVGDVVSLNNDVRREIGFACEDIREAGIDIYTVTYSVSDQRTNRVLAECANIDDHFIAARGNSGLRDAFETIAHSLVRTELRIAR